MNEEEEEEEKEQEQEVVSNMLVLCDMYLSRWIHPNNDQ
jgi:hypothetical protein